ncbi:RNase adapter RapZ [Litoribacillus peritrichatus]|uniref:RNase adapter RapZ n=1 Tax=Litoribacillus peritrichatus TaxID=718191 RepID=A0ABP7N820_9GAMM
MKMILISGRSGSGKSSALHALEDCGFYCIDNLPRPLLTDLIKNIANHVEYENTAVSIDVRNFSGDSDQLNNLLAALTEYNIEHQIIFLDSCEDILVKRYNASRRKHPLTSEQRSLREAIQKDKELLTPLMDAADLVVDTSNMSIHDLRDLIRNRITVHQSHEVSLLIQSFGFKYGVPTDSDLMFDVRCLPNPYWEPSLRNFNGKDPEIAEFLSHHDSSKKMLADIQGFIEYWVPMYKKSGRAYITISIGCTGGCHRSVYIAEQLTKYFNTLYSEVHLKHIQL